MHFWVFDNDGTLYKDAMAEREFMGLLYVFVSRKLGLGLESSRRIVAEQKARRHTSSSLIALVAEMGFDYDEARVATYEQIDYSVCGALRPSPESKRSCGR